MKLIILSSLDRSDVTRTTDPLNIVDAWLTKPVRQSELIETILLAIDCDRKTLSISKEDKPSKIKQGFKGNHILLVEDNEINQEIALEILTDAGFTVDAKNNGLEAMTAVEECSYDSDAIHGWFASNKTNKRKRWHI